MATKHIIVVGGSLAGLMNAIPLLELGHNVTILERSPVPLLHDQGAGIGAGGETLAWVQKFGRKSEEEISVDSDWRYYLDRKGNIIYKETSGLRLTSWKMLYSIGREQFDGACSGSGGVGKYEYGRTATAVRDLVDQIEVEFKQQREGEVATDGSVRGDFLIVADGPSSRLRKMVLDDPDERRYAGYVAFRGTVPEGELSREAKNVFVEKLTFFHGMDPNTQILAYTIPNSKGSVVKGERLVNWVWYHNINIESEEYSELMTDKDGNRHRFTLPTGGNMQDKVWQRQKQTARDQLPPQFDELIQLTTQPFVQAVTDLKPPAFQQGVGPLLGGKVILVGDALAGFRPHTAASTSQAALHALKLDQVFRGGLSWEKYQADVFEFATSMQTLGVRMGEESQFGRHPLAG